MRPPLLMMLGAGPWQLPVIRRARLLGVRVLAVDRDADRPGYREAHAWAQADLYDVGALIRLAREQSVDGVLAPTSDVGVASAAAVAEELGLPGIGRAAALACTDKAVLAQTLRRAPQGGRDSLCLAPDQEPTGDWAAWPVVVKPVDAQSGRGVRIVQEAQALPAALAHARAHSRSGRVLLDPWIPGVEYIADVFVWQGRITLLGLCRKKADPANPTVAAELNYSGRSRVLCLGRPGRARAAHLVGVDWLAPGHLSPGIHCE